MAALSHDQRRRMARADADLAAGRLDRAERTVRAVIEEGADDPRLDHFLGLVLIARGDAEAALAHLESAAAAGGLEPVADLADALRQAGRAADALARLDAAADRADPRAASARGHALADLGRWEEAASAYREALAAEPNRVEALAGLGRALLARGDAAGAAEELGAALQFAPHDASLYLALGRALLASGRVVEAEERAQSALALAPGLEAAQALLDDCADAGRRRD